jgi:integrase
MPRRRGRESIIHETVRILQEMTRFGESKHEAKQAERERALAAGEKYVPGKVPGIFSYSTYHAYMEHCLAFAQWARSEYGAKSLAEAKEHAGEYLRREIAVEKSAWTIRLEAAALAKLYGCSSTDFGVELPKRNREEITRSREDRAHDRKFSEERNRDIVDFCRGTGLRRREVADVSPEDIRTYEGVVWVHVENGKGGREREVRVVGEYAPRVLELKEQAEGRERMFEHIPGRADIHAWRREYASARYAEIESDPEQLEAARRAWERWKEDHGYTGPDTYTRRSEDRRVFDRAILLGISRDMGHNRVDVVARYYL